MKQFNSYKLSNNNLKDVVEEIYNYTNKLSEEIKNRIASIQFKYGKVSPNIIRNTINSLGHSFTLERKENLFLKLFTKYGTNFIV